MYKLDLIPEEKRAGYEKRKFEKTIALIVSYVWYEECPLHLWGICAIQLREHSNELSWKEDAICKSQIQQRWWFWAMEHKTGTSIKEDLKYMAI